MIGDIATRVAADLRARKFPHLVVYGPERVARDGFDSVIVFSRDRQAGDPIIAPAGGTNTNPRVPFNRNVSGRVVVYARSAKPGATPFDHEEECDLVCDGVITALNQVLMAGGFLWAITESRILTREELRAEAEVDARDDGSGKRSADFPGCAARIRFTVRTAIRSVTYQGAAGPTGTVFDFAVPAVTAGVGVAPAVVVPPSLPSLVPSLVAWWSGNYATPSSVVNRAGGSVGAMTQSVAADRPAVIVFGNNVRALQFDGQTQEMSTPDVPALRWTGAKGYWAGHVRQEQFANAHQLFNQWGASERISIMWTISGQRIEVRVANSDLTFAQLNFPLLHAQLSLGAWLEVLYDGTQPGSNDRCQLWVDGVRVQPNGVGGTMPPTLNAGDATEVWLAAMNGAENGRWDIAHWYICNDLPTTAQRDAMRATEAPAWD